jgi:hypothetical protein
MKMSLFPTTVRCTEDRQQCSHPPEEYIYFNTNMLLQSKLNQKKSDYFPGSPTGSKSYVIRALNLNKFI